jgi:hypothetical protein
VANGSEESAETELRPGGGAATCDLPRAIKLGPGPFFVLGDNRQAQDDSRTGDPVPAGWFIGKIE